MTRHYKSARSTMRFIIISALVVGCQSSLTYNQALQRNIDRIEDPERLDDARFLVDAASFNLLAIQTAETAIKSGYSAALVAMARENLDDHKEMGTELRKLARREKILLPGELNETHQKILDELTDTDRREFDRTYVRLMREAGREDRKKFSRMATDAESKDVRAFAARRLGLFDSHEKGFETLDAQLLKTY